MKRLKKMLDVMQGGIILALIVGFIQWISAWVMLIFNWKSALSLFIVTGITFTICVLLIFVWGITLRKTRKKALKIAYNILEKKRIQANLTGKIKVEMMSGYIIWITFYTHSIGVLSEQDIISEITKSTEKMFKVMYVEYLPVD